MAHGPILQVDLLCIVALSTESVAASNWAGSLRRLDKLLHLKVRVSFHCNNMKEYLPLSGLPTHVLCCLQISV